MAIKYLDISKIERAGRNPKLHDTENIVNSIRRYGFVGILILDTKSKRLAHGHGSLEALEIIKKAGDKPPENIKITESGAWEAPVIEKSFESQSDADAYALTVNKLVEKGGWNVGLLNEMLAELSEKSIEPIGFDLLKEMQTNIDQNIEDVSEAARRMLPQESEDANPVTNPFGLQPTIQPGKRGTGEVKMDASGMKHAEAKYPYSGASFDNIPGNLASVFQIEENHVFTSSNKWGIPDLLPNMILDEIPQPIQTWGGKAETPDDGNYFLYVFGSTASLGVPYERSIAAWWTNDNHVKTFLTTPAYRVGQLLNAHIYGAVVPDVSLWFGNPLIQHLYGLYQAAWMGRFMQEAGIKIIPRFEYFLPETREYSLLGIPKNPPTLATQLHTSIEDVPAVKESLMTGLDQLRPKQFLVYVSAKGREIMEDLRKELPVEELILLPTAKHVRRGPRTEPNPYLRELRKRKPNWTGITVEAEEES